MAIGLSPTTMGGRKSIATRELESISKCSIGQVAESTDSWLPIGWGLTDAQAVTALPTALTILPYVSVHLAGSGRAVSQ